MKTEEIKIANLKCGGCATTIKKELLELIGVDVVKVDNDNDSVTVTYKEEVRENILHRLHQLGYPEATAENRLLMKAKSYANCMIGKVSS